MKLKATLFLCALSVLLVSCSSKSMPAPEMLSVVGGEVSVEAQAERDEIYTLTAYGVVLNDWQNGEGDKRGHNIGSVLVNPEGKIVRWARNCNAALANGTQHGEVRLMMGYLNAEGGYSLKGFTVYTSLEPCAQCSGMMILTSVYRTVYGQSDPGFGGALERLALDSKKWNEEGFEPYPRKVISDKSESEYCARLDEAYGNAGGSITKFLLTDEAKEIFTEAVASLNSYELKYPEENGGVLSQAKEMLEGVTPGIPVICLEPKVN